MRKNKKITKVRRLPLSVMYISIAM